MLVLENTHIRTRDIYCVPQVMPAEPGQEGDTHGRLELSQRVDISTSSAQQQP